MSAPGTLPRPATLRALTGKDTSAIPVHFNPASLQYTVTNTLKEGGRGNERKQVVTQSSGKLTLDLVFDTTTSGDDVRDTTKRIGAFMEPDKPASPRSKKQTAKVVEFHWGVYTFNGMLESYKETIDFFSVDGVPLRSSVSLTLARQDEVFAPPAPGASGINRNPSLSPDNLDVVDVPPGPENDPSTVATRAGSAEGARELGAANGAESLRFAAPGGLTLSGSVTLGGPAAFAGGSGVEAGIGISASAGGGARFGGSASAGLSFSEGAFAGLQAGAGVSASAAFDTSLVLPGAQAAAAMDAGAGFELGGAAVNRTSGSLRADVGASASLSARLRFEES